MQKTKEVKEREKRAELLERARKYLTEEALGALLRYNVPLQEIIAMGERGFEVLKRAKKDTFKIPTIEIREEVGFNNITAVLPTGKEVGCELDGAILPYKKRRRWIPVWLFEDLHAEPGSRKYTAALMSLFLP